MSGDARTSKPRPALPDGPYLVVGLARSGRAAALVLRERGEPTIGVDRDAPEELDALSDAGVELHLAEDGLRCWSDVAALSSRAPACPRRRPSSPRPASAGCPCSASWSSRGGCLANEFIAVTGTNGKTTTVELIGHIHRAAGAAGGGRRQRRHRRSAASSATIGPEVTIVCEASSFQLEDTLAFAPEAAVLLNIAPDHLDRHATIEDYTAAKLQIFARQSRGDVAVLPADLDVELDEDVWRVTFGPPSIPRGDPRSAAVTLGDDGVILWQGEPLLPASEIALRGRHNLDNAMAAAAVCLARGIDPTPCARVCARSRACPTASRSRRHEDVVYVNDSKATNVASTLVALDAFAPGVVHLILGGQPRGRTSRRCASRSNATARPCT